MENDSRVPLPQTPGIDFGYSIAANEDGSGYYIKLSNGEKGRGVTVLERYAVIRQIGAGGSSITYQALDEMTGKIVILKEYLPADMWGSKLSRNGVELAANPFLSSEEQTALAENLNALQSEELNAAERLRFVVDSVGNPNNDGNYFNAYAAVNKAEQNRFHRFIVIETTAGMSLADAVFCNELTPEERVVDKLGVALRLCERVQQLHEQKQLLHCDLKPSNVYITEQAVGDSRHLANHHIIIIDFASVMPMENGHVSGTPSFISLTENYAAPELRRAAALFSSKQEAPERFEKAVAGIGPPTDVYAIVAILFQLLSGESQPLYEIDSTSFADTDVGAMPPLIQDQLLEIKDITCSSRRQQCFPDANVLHARINSVIDSIQNRGITITNMRNNSKNKAEDAWSSLTIDSDLLPTVSELGNAEESTLKAFVDEKWNSRNRQKCNARHIILYGPGGSGKTTSLIWLWHNLRCPEAACAGGKGGLDTVPLLIPADSLLLRETAIRDYLFIHYAGVVSADANENQQEWRCKKFAQLFSNKAVRYVLLIDGIGEPEFPERLFKEIKELSSYNGVQIVISSKTRLDRQQPFIDYSIADTRPLHPDIVRAKLAETTHDVPDRLLNVLNRPMFLAIYLGLQLDVRLSGSHHIYSEGGLLLAEVERVISRAEVTGGNRVCLEYIFKCLLPALCHEQVAPTYHIENVAALERIHQTLMANPKLSGKYLTAIREKVSSCIGYSDSYFSYYLNSTINKELIASGIIVSQGCSYRFRHHNYFLLMKALFIYNEMNSCGETLPSCLTSERLSDEVLRYLGDLFGEFTFKLKSDTSSAPSPIEGWLALHCRGSRGEQAAAAVANCVRIMKLARDYCIVGDYSDLDLSKTEFYGCSIPNSVFDNSLISKRSFSILKKSGLNLCSFVFVGETKHLLTAYYDENSDQSEVVYLDLDTATERKLISIKGRVNEIVWFDHNVGFAVRVGCEYQVYVDQLLVLERKHGISPFSLFPDIKSQCPVRCMCVSRDGTYLVRQDTHEYLLRDIHDSDYSYNLVPPEEYCVLYISYANKDGRCILICKALEKLSGDKCAMTNEFVVVLWDYAQKRCVKAIELGHGLPSVIIAEDEKSFLVCLDSVPNEKLLKAGIEESMILRNRFHNHIWVSMDVGGLKMFPTTKTNPNTANTLSKHFYPLTTNELCVLTYANVVELYDMAHNRTIYQVRCIPNSSVCISKSGRYIAIVSAATITLMDVPATTSTMIDLGKHPIITGWYYDRGSKTLFISIVLFADGRHFFALKKISLRAQQTLITKTLANQKVILCGCSEGVILADIANEAFELYDSDLNVLYTFSGENCEYFHALKRNHGGGIRKFTYAPGYVCMLDTQARHILLFQVFRKSVVVLDYSQWLNKEFVQAFQKSRSDIKDTACIALSSDGQTIALCCCLKTQKNDSDIYKTNIIMYNLLSREFHGTVRQGFTSPIESIWFDENKELKLLDSSGKTLTYSPEQTKFTAIVYLKEYPQIQHLLSIISPKSRLTKIRNAASIGKEIMRLADAYGNLDEFSGSLKNSVAIFKENIRRYLSSRVRSDTSEKKSAYFESATNDIWMVTSEKQPVSASQKLTPNYYLHLFDQNGHIKKRILLQQEATVLFKKELQTRPGISISGVSERINSGFFDFQHTILDYDEERDFVEVIFLDKANGLIVWFLSFSLCDSILADDELLQFNDFLLSPVSNMENCDLSKTYTSFFGKRVFLDMERLY